VADPEGRMLIAHPEDQGHWRHWDRPDDDDNPRWPPDSLKPWPGQKKKLKPGQCPIDPNGDAPPWSPPEDASFDPEFDSPDSPFYIPPLERLIFGRPSMSPRMPVFRPVMP